MFRLPLLSGAVRYLLGQNFLVFSIANRVHSLQATSASLVTLRSSTSAERSSPSISEVPRSAFRYPSDITFSSNLLSPSSILALLLPFIIYSKFCFSKKSHFFTRDSLVQLPDFLNSLSKVQRSSLNKLFSRSIIDKSFFLPFDSCM